MKSETLVFKCFKFIKTLNCKKSNEFLCRGKIFFMSQTMQCLSNLLQNCKTEKKSVVCLKLLRLQSFYLLAVTFETTKRRAFTCSRCQAAHNSLLNFNRVLGAGGYCLSSSCVVSFLQLLSFSYCLSLEYAMMLIFF